jgi:hypothetical protein
MTTVKVKVRTSNTGQIRVRTSNTTDPVTVKTATTQTARMDRLLDVDASSEIEGGVPVYNTQLDKYVIEKLDISQIEGSSGGDIDGGTY